MLCQLHLLSYIVNLSFQINQDIYPVGTYSNLSLLILVFFVTDWARYKPIIILEGLAGVTVYCLIIWGRDISAIQVF